MASSVVALFNMKRTLIALWAALSPYICFDSQGSPGTLGGHSAADILLALAIPLVSPFV